jgi:hypothetical protein
VLPLISQAHNAPAGIGTFPPFTIDDWRLTIGCKEPDRKSKIANHKSVGVAGLRRASPSAPHDEHYDAFFKPRL